MTQLLAALPSPADNTLDIGPLTIFYYGILIAIGILVAVYVSKVRYSRFEGDADVLERVAIWAVVAGLLGARLGYVITHSGNFGGRPWAVFFIWEGGLALYGGLTAGFLAAIFLIRRWNGDGFAMSDAVAVGIPLAQAIGRWGNYFNQELFGTPSTLPWAIEIDVVNRPAQYLDFETFHPTFFYESLWNVVLTVGIILWLERKGKLFKGASIALYFIVYGTGRFLLELLRTDTTFRFLGLSRNGWLSILVVTGGLVALYWFQKRAEPRTLAGSPSFFAPGEATVDVPATGPKESKSKASKQADTKSDKAPTKRE